MKRLLSVLLLTLVFAPAGRAGAQWVQTNGPFGGAISAYAMNDGSIFAGTYDGTVFRSTDGGNHWSLRSNGLSGGAVNALASIGTNLFEAGDSGVYVSSDGGTNWHSSNNGIPSTIYGHEKVWLLAESGKNLFAVTWDSGIYRSSNGGNSWNFLKILRNGSVWSSPYITSLIVHDSNIIAGTFGFGIIGDIFRSTDAGIHWSESNIANTQTTDELYAMESRLFAGTEDGVYASTDNGVSWTQSGLGGQNILSLTGSGSELAAGTYSGVFLSSDSGRTWSGSTKGMTDPEVFSLLVNDDTILAGGYSGVFASTDGGRQWEPANSGLIGATFCWFLPEGASILGGSKGQGGIWRTTDDGVQWNLVWQGVNSHCVVMSGHNLYSGCDGEVDVSLDSGASWRIWGNQLLPFDPVVKVLGIAAFDSTVYISADGAFFNTDGYGIYSSSDGDTSWVDANAGILADALYDGPLTSLGSDLFVGTSAGLYRSLDSGTTWKLVSDGMPPNSSIVAFTSIGSDLFAGTAASGVMRSTNSGNSWTPINTGLPNESLCINALSASAGNLFVSTTGSLPSRGLYVSTNEGASWTSIGDGLSDYVDAITVHDSELLVSTAYTGVWRRPLSQVISSSSVSEASPINNSLSSFPNPFSQSTQIAFTLPNAGYAEVSIVNILGAEVARLYSGTLGAGEHTFTWKNAEDVAAGSYWCIVRTSDGVRRIGLLRQ